MGKRNRPGKRERQKRRDAARLPELMAALDLEADGPAAAVIRSEIARLELAKASIAAKRLKKPRVEVPMPESYVKEVEEKRLNAHRQSGFDTIRAHFVQGGSPGGGRRS